MWSITAYSGVIYAFYNTPNLWKLYLEVKPFHVDDRVIQVRLNGVSYEDFT